MWKFLELGGVGFGGGYVLLAFLRRDLVDGLHWLGIGPLLAAVLAGALDGLNAVAISLMAGVAVPLGRQAVVDPLTARIGLATLGVLVRFRVNAAVLIVAGAAIGVVHVYA